ncbi:MAG TPA: EamA family transporter RarD [Limnobacter sp.]|nr:EamA family transporter RarD [Limnobacter sp.]
MSKGVFLSVLASILFGALYYYASLLKPLSGEQIFGWRMLLTFPAMTAFLWLSKDWGLVSKLWGRLRARPLLLLALPVSSFLLAIQLWLFMWAPLHGKALDVSLGYFMLPLSMVLLGRVLYGERLSPLQTTAVALACVGVAHELWRVSSFSWASMLVCLGYPYYFVLRKKIQTDHLGGLWFDMLLMLPVALFFAIDLNAEFVQTYADHPSLYALVPLLGVISASALIAYIASSKLLPFGVFGLLGYVEPVLLVFVAIALGESIAAEQWMTYMPVWAAVLCLVIDGLRMTRARSGS